MSETEESLSQILSREAPAEATGVTVEKTEAAPPAAKTEEAPAKTVVRDETGKFAKADPEPAKPIEAAKPAEPAKPADKPVPKVDVAAIIDERRKRQAAEARLAELQKSQPQKVPSVFEDEDGAIRTRVTQETQSLRGMLFNMSLKAARTQYGEKFEEAQQGFLEATEANPNLLRDWQNSEDPGEFLYRHGLFHKKLASVGGDLTKFEEQVTATTKAELDTLKTQYDAVKAELEALKATQADLANLPKSLNNRASGAQPKAGELGDDESITQIARFGNKSR